MNRICALLLAAFLLIGFSGDAAAREIRVGVCVYNAAILRAIDMTASEDVRLIVADDVREQNQQVDRIEKLLEAGIDVLIVNLIDRTAAVYIIRLAMNANIPIVFVNSEPLPEDMALYDSAYYVGSNAQVSGYYSGQIAADYFISHPGFDKNGDGSIQLVLLKGQAGHQDTEFRSHYSLCALRDSGFGVEILAEEIAMWELEDAQEKMATALATYGDSIECVISNNDEMAKGAIESLKAAGYFADGKYMPVTGVDGTAPSTMRALAEGTMLGTVLNDTTTQGEAALNLAVLLAKSQELTLENLGFPVDNERYVWIPSRQIRSSNIPAIDIIDIFGN